MALAISNIPVLTGNVAMEFVRRAEAAERNRGCIDFSREHAECQEFERKNRVRMAALRAKYTWLS